MVIEIKMFFFLSGKKSLECSGHFVFVFEDCSVCFIWIVSYSSLFLRAPCLFLENEEHNLMLIAPELQDLAFQQDIKYQQDLAFQFRGQMKIVTCVQTASFLGFDLLKEPHPSFSG